MISRAINKIGEYAKTIFVVNWASASLIFGAITYSVVMYYQNQALKDTIVKQGETVKTLTETVKTQGSTINNMNASFEAIKTTVEAFTAHPPSTFDEKINGIYRIIDIYHGNGNASNNPPAFSSNQPNGNTPNSVPNQ